MEDEKLLYAADIAQADGAAPFRLRVSCIAPSSADVERYHAQLKHCFDAQRRLKSSVPPLPHNMISAALVVEYGQTRLVLGGDVEKAGWEEVLQERGAERLASQAVKVSHHGSTNGYCDGLWAAFSRESTPIAIITPYQRQRLPKEEACRHINAHTTQMVTTCASAIPFATTTYYDLWENYDPREQLALTLFFPTFRADRGYQGGICSCYFNAQQERLAHAAEFTGAAGPM